MKAAVLSPGPSLLDCVPSLGKYDLLVAVNRVPFILRDIKVHAWCFDSRAFLSDSIGYCPTLCCSMGEWYIAVESHREICRTHEFVSHESMLKTWPGAMGWSDFSATSAIILAAHLGATSIDCYGSDWTCEPDADGVSLPSNRRTPERFKEEAVVWGKVAQYLGSRKIGVERKAT